MFVVWLKLDRKGTQYILITTKDKQTMMSKQAGGPTDSKEDIGLFLEFRR